MIPSFRKAFDSFENRIHLNNAGVTPITLEAKTAISAWAEKLAREGILILDDLFQVFSESKSRLSKLIDCDSEEVAYTSTCAASITQAAFGLHLQPGDEVIQWEQEYPSNAYPWIALAKQKGIQLTRIASLDFQINSELLVSKISSKTKVVALSWVQFQTGAQSDLKKIAKACHEVGALLVVDAIQGLGILPFSFKATGVDILCAGSHKWLCSPLGLGLLVMKKELISQCQPILHGAFTYGTPEDEVLWEKEPVDQIGRFEPGSPPVLPVVGLNGSLKAMEQAGGVKVIWEKANALSNQLRQGLKSVGFQAYDSQDQGGNVEHLSPIVTLNAPEQRINAFDRELTKHHITHALRAGGIRLSPHAFNEEAEIDEVIKIARRV